MDADRPEIVRSPETVCPSLPADQRRHDPGHSSDDSLSTCRVLSPSPLALPHHFADIRRWTYLDCSTLQLHSRTLGNELNCVIQISRFKHLNSTQLLLRFRVRTVRHCNLSVLPRHGHRRVGGLKRFLSDQMSVLPQFVVVAKTLVQHGVALALRHVFELAWLEIAQTDVFHQFLLVSRDSESRSSSFCYQIVVRETENRQLLHFFWPRQRNLWATDAIEWRPEVACKLPRLSYSYQEGVA